MLGGGANIDGREISADGNVRYYDRAILINPHVNGSVIVFVQGQATVSVITALGVGKLQFQWTGLQRFDGIRKSLSRRERVLAKSSARVIDNDGLDGFRAGVNEIYFDHPGAAASHRKNRRKNNDQQAGAAVSFHFFSITRAARTAPLRLSCSLRGKTRMFQFQRLFFFGR